MGWLTHLVPSGHNAMLLDLADEPEGRNSRGTSEKGKTPSVMGALERFLELSPRSVLDSGSLTTHDKHSPWEVLFPPCVGCKWNYWLQHLQLHEYKS